MARQESRCENSPTSPLRVGYSPWFLWGRGCYPANKEFKDGVSCQETFPNCTPTHFLSVIRHLSNSCWSYDAKRDTGIPMELHIWYIYIYLVVSALWWMAHLSIFEPYPHGWYTDTRATDWSRLCGLGPGEKYHGRQLEALATFTSQTIGNLRWYPPKKGCIYPYLQVRNITFEPFSFFCILLWIPTV